MRKTVSILDLIEMANAYNQTSSDSYKAIRIGQNVMVENILHNAGVYSGYRHYTNLELSANQTPGVRYNADGILPYDERFVNTDDTRRNYYIHPYLLK